MEFLFDGCKNVSFQTILPLSESRFMLVIFSFYYNFFVNDFTNFHWFYELILIGDYSFFSFLPFLYDFIATALKKNFHAPLDDVGYDPIL